MRAHRGSLRSGARSPRSRSSPPRPPPASPSRAKQGSADYRVGIAQRSISPDPDGTFAGQPVYLGGYGIGGGSPVFAGRAATGILGGGPSVRAFAVADRDGNVFAIADIETQGWFVATKDGPYGLLDMREAVEERTGGELDAEHVVVQTDHSHSGADTMGVWGGVPPEYRSYMFDQTVDAIVEAYETHAPRQALLRHRAGARPALEPVRLRRRERQRRRGLRRARAAGPRQARTAVRDAPELLRPHHRPRLGQHEDLGRLGAAGQPAARAALRRRGDDGRRNARTHAAGRPRLQRSGGDGRGRAEPLQAARLRGPGRRPRRGRRRRGQAARRRPARGRPLLPDRGRHLEPAPARPPLRRRPDRRPDQPRDHAALADGQRARHRHGDRADRRRPALLRPGRDVSADPAQGRGDRARPRLHDRGPRQRPARLPDRPVRVLPGADPPLVLQRAGRRGLARSTTTTTSSTSRTRWASG